MLELLLLVSSGIVTGLFFFYGFNCFYILANAKRYRSPLPATPLQARPSVAIHLPIYRERYVARRLLEACGSVADQYGRHLVRIMVLDDSDDETAATVDAVADELVHRGVRVEVVRRGNRRGFKAGALQNALERTVEKYVAVFDADFVPPPDFLVRVVPHLEGDNRLALVQTRWAHLNRGFSLLTKAIALGMDAHFFVEQPGRYQARCFLNFNGSAGVIRVAALREAGGWHADTLAEDLDLSYRAQMAGYEVLYLKDVEVPGEVPPTMTAFKRQQARWALGSLQTARKLLPSILTSRRFTLKQKLEAALHLTYYFVHPLILASFLLASAAALLNLDILGPRFSPGTLQGIVLTPNAGLGLILFGALGGAILLCWLAVWLYYVATLKQQKLSLVKNLPTLMLLGLLGYGISITNTLRALKALFGGTSPFMRTPKYALAGRDDTWKGKHYQVPLTISSLLEAAGVSLGAIGAWQALHYANWGIVPILLAFTLSFGVVGGLTVFHSVRGGTG